MQKISYNGSPGPVSFYRVPFNSGAFHLRHQYDSFFGTWFMLNLDKA